MSPIRHFFENYAIKPHGVMTQIMVKQGLYDDKIRKMEEVYDNSDEEGKLSFGIKDGKVIDVDKLYDKYDEIFGTSIQKVFMSRRF